MSKTKQDQPRPAQQQYMLVSHVDHARFQERVTALMGDGWQPIGGVSLGEYHEPESRRRMPGYHQAMVRR